MPNIRERRREERRRRRDAKRWRTTKTCEENVFSKGRERRPAENDAKSMEHAGYRRSEKFSVENRASRHGGCCVRDPYSVIDLPAVPEAATQTHVCLSNTDARPCALATSARTTLLVESSRLTWPVPTRARARPRCLLHWLACTIRSIVGRNDTAACNSIFSLSTLLSFC